MSERDLHQLRARLSSLRDQRNRMVHRRSDLERRAAAEVQVARGKVEELRRALAAATQEVAALKPEVEAFERGQPPPTDVDDWRVAWREMSARLADAQERQARLAADAELAERQLQRALVEQESSSTDEARALAGVEQEIAELTRDVGRLQAEQPPVEAPDPGFREVLMDRLRNLEAERTWINEEISASEERLRRIAAEAAQVRALLEIHTPDWGRAALDALAPEPQTDRSVPAWKQGVLEILSAASKPLHYREIADQLAATGRSLGGQDPAETLLAALGRDQDFVRVRRGAYWLRSRPLPQATPPQLPDAQGTRERDETGG